MPARQFDVVIASDFRFPGGTSASIAEEIKAQAKAGYTTALLHLPVRELHRRFNASIRRCIEDGLATLLVGPDTVETRLLVIRHPRALVEWQPDLARVKAEKTLVVVNQPPADDTSDTPYYDVAAVLETLDRLSSADVAWIPIGPLVRASMTAYQSQINLVDRDWVNIIDVDEWQAPRETFVADRPVIGRHSRLDRRKWPESAEILLAAYPDGDRYGVKVLGGADPAAEVLGTIPNSWEVFPFNAVSPREFLALIDFYVFYHHSGYVEAFGRGILEALASGAVAIVPEHFRELFGDACLYAEPSQVTRAIDRLYADPAAYREQSQRGTRFARERFGQEVHTRRLYELIGSPSGVAKHYRSPGVPSARRILFVTSNGIGLGHLARTMAIARRLPRGVEPLWFTLSTGYSFVQQQGWPVEYMPARHSTAWHWRRSKWNDVFRARLQLTIDSHKPDVLVFDGTNPYDGLVDVRNDNPNLAFVWSRRGMWKAGMSEQRLARAGMFDLILEPGEFAAAFDEGATARDVRSVVRVNPIVMLDERELLDADAARRELGLDPNRTSALVQLGMGDPHDVNDKVRRAVQQLWDAGVQVCVAQTGRDTLTSIPGTDARFVTAFPITRYAHAFDFGLTASGYNTYHEAIAFALPTVFVPNESAELDDQVARARYAEQVGVGLHLERLDADVLDRCLPIMLDHHRRLKMAARCRELFPGNGAADAARVIETARPGRDGGRRQPVLREGELSDAG